MQYNDFKGEKISALGFGLMRLPVIDGDQAKVDKEALREMILYAVGNGVNYYDTAYPYHNGFSEKTLGEIAAEEGLRDKINIATKLFTLMMNSPNFSPEAMMTEQLERLKAERIDFYLMHGLSMDKWVTLRDKFDIINFMDRAKKSGRIRYAGFCFQDDTPAFKAILDDYDWDFAQIQYNYADTEIQAGDEGFEYARQKKVPLAIMEPIKGGNLIFPESDEVKAIIKEGNFGYESTAELALRFVADKKGLLTVLSGMGTMEQVKENIAIFDRPAVGCFTPAENEAVEKIKKYLIREAAIPCTDCRYCLQGCPNKINIPRAFSIFNQAKKYGNRQAGMRDYNRSCTNLKDCTECRACADACPQQLDIPELLKGVVDYFEA